MDTPSVSYRTSRGRGRTPCIHLWFSAVFPRDPSKAARKSKRILTHCLDFAVERGHLTANPVSYHRNPAGAIKWKPPKVNKQVDKRSVPSPQQGRRLLDAVGREGRSGHLLRPFFAVMYFAGLRPEEAVNLLWSDLTLPGYVWDLDSGGWTVPESEWGEITVREVAPDVGRMWTDSGQKRDRRPPKGRAEGETRPVPSVPMLSRILRDHRIARGGGSDDLVFIGERGRQLATSTYSKMWRKARKRALTPQELASPLAQRPHDLRSACVSAWLISGTPPRQVAEWAGHGLDVLLGFYARILDGSEDESRRRMADGFDGF